MTTRRIVSGTAGWALRTDIQSRFGGAGTHLMRYARCLAGVEINSSFYRPHRRSTYQRWAASVPPEFRFAVKVPRTITHERRLIDIESPLDAFLDEVAGLGPALGPLLVQLPPSLAFDAHTAATFLRTLRGRYGGAVALEPRHRSWFTPAVDALLVEHRVAGVAADPPAGDPAAAMPRGDRALVYLRLHGSPVVYHSRYAPEQVARVARTLTDAAALGADAWCIFDNTADGAATENALELEALLEGAVVSVGRRATPAADRSPSS